MVKKRTLLLIAGLVWGAAGANILRIGIVSALETSLKWFQVLLTLLVLAAFGAMFSRIVFKHRKRILGYEGEKRPFWQFFNVPSYILMVGMMTLGIVLRHFTPMPLIFFSVFYSGLGTALSLAGVAFIVLWIVELKKPNQTKETET